MAFQPRARTPREFSRRHDKGKQRSKTDRRQESSDYQYREEKLPTCKEISDRTLNSLRHLGTQKFAVAPYHEHFGRWLLNLKNVMSEFSSSPAATLDEQFRTESSKILSDTESALNDRRLKEIARGKAVQDLNQKVLEARSVLALSERKYVANMKEISGEKERAAKSVLTDIGKLRSELDRIVRMRTGFFRGVSRKAKEQKTAEASERLDSEKKELATIERSFATEQERLRSEYKKTKQRILAQIAEHQKEINNLDLGSDIDDSLDARRLACDSLINAVSSLLQRNKTDSETADSS